MKLKFLHFGVHKKYAYKKNHNIDIQTLVQSSALATQSPPLAESPSEEPIQSNTDSEPQDIIESNSSNSVEIIAPLVGTFYQSAKPGSPVFVKEGDTIQVGQIICIIEAMKIFNEIEAEVSGKVIKIIVNDSSPVEYGQPLILVEPS